MNFGTAIQVCMGKYATFDGRATRSEFWWFYLFTLILSWGASIVDAVAMGPQSGEYLSLLVNLAILIPSIAASSRRLHDTNRSGWWALIMFTIIGLIPLIFWWAQPSDASANTYGEPQAE